MNKAAKLTLYAVMLMAGSFLAWCFGFGGFELVTLGDGKPNNTISHIMALLTIQYPWLPYAVVGFFGIFVLFWINVFGHWWVKGWWWKPAVFVDEEGENKQEKDEVKQ